MLGGLGIFLLGMKILSEGLQAVSGEGLRKFMALATTHRIAGVGTGLLATMIVQSSSVITVMAVGFVASGLMALQQSINVVIGANIGTTITAWIVAFAPSPKLVGLTGLAIGGLLYFFIQKEKIHNIGYAILGLGLVFLGLYFMSEGAMPIRQNPEISKMFQMLNASSYLGILQVILVGLIFTLVIQSSSATIAIVMTLATQHLISYDVAITIMFGANIGTTVTAWLAALGTPSREAKRTALSHTMLNVIGTLVLFPFIPYIISLGQSLFPEWSKVTVTLADGTKQFFQNWEAIPAAFHADKTVKMAMLGVMIPIAATDTAFAVFRGIVVLVFMKPFVKLIRMMIPQGRGEEKPHLSVLNSRTRQSPVIACDQASMEVKFMAESDLELFETVYKVLNNEADDKDENHIIHREDVLDNVQKEVTEFLGKIMTSRLPSDVALRARELLRMSDEFESVSDEFPAILKVIKRLRRQKQRISDASAEVLKRAHTLVFEFAKEVTSSMNKQRSEISVGLAQEKSKEIHNVIRDLRQGQLLRVGQDDPMSPLRVLVELDILNAYNRIRGYYLNIAEILAGGKK
jgi:phosphate:Na+ symporter